MAQTFVKLFQSMLDSTVWDESHATRIVWVTMLAMADADGQVHAAVPGLARRARVTVEECEHALGRLSAPDKYSRTKDHAGRRVADIDGGWQILNHERYRRRESKEYKRERDRERMRRLRSENRSNSDGVANSRFESPGGATVAKVAHADADADADAERTPPTPLEGGKRSLGSKSNPTRPELALADDRVMRVAEHYKATWRKSRWDPSVRAKAGGQNHSRAVWILNALEGHGRFFERAYSEAEVCRAITAHSRSDFHRGDNDARKAYDCVCYALRGIDEWLGVPDDGVVEGDPYSDRPHAVRIDPSEYANERY